jgi:spectinomycin phosphotransferase/16S rRNA (guanine(1405)-N(7))-methyltransferase
LIDWDTALLAPPERDLWLADARSAGRVGIRYAGLTGCALLPELLRAYEIAWALADLEAFITSLRGTLICTEDTAWSWNALEDTVRELPGLLSRAETHA